MKAVAAVRNMYLSMRNMLRFVSDIPFPRAGASAAKR
jgi:hypothetical protein